MNMIRKLTTCIKTMQLSRTGISKPTQRIIVILSLACMALFPSCKRYLDVVPDNVATIDNAFNLRNQAQKYLLTCYSYLPALGDMKSNPALITGDEVWFFYPYLANDPWGPIPTNWELARGNQNINDPIINYWDGKNGGKPLFQALRDCNTFLENIGRVPDMDSFEKSRWVAEVKFLKAYYHWFLLRMYGPIPIVDKNLPVSSSPDMVKVYRNSVDSCFNYIVNLIDSAAVDLPNVVDFPVSEMGRITKPIALAIKARILMTGASPLFNGNSDMDYFTDNKGRHLFTSEYDPSKWQRAAEACKDAIDLCESLGYKLYHFIPPAGTGINIGSEMQTQMDIRNAICEKWNSEIIWGATNSMASKIQEYGLITLSPSIPPNQNTGPFGSYAPPLKIAQLFYTKNGLPINQDKTWNYAAKYNLDTATQDDRFYIAPGYVTARLNFDREPRFYADLGFDGGTWYGQGQYDDSSPLHVEGRAGDYSAKRRAENYSITGYYAKKIVNYLTVTGNDGKIVIQSYPWPIIRLADLYLYYSEALNEVDGPTNEALKWINLVRERAGVPSVQESWDNFSTMPGKYQTKEGFRAIIHQERLIEMAFEGNRFWDLRRWKEALPQMNGPIEGWDITKSDPQGYYTPVLLFAQTYPSKYYFWPISENKIVTNSNLVQNPGW